MCPVSVKLLAFWGDSVWTSIVAQLITELFDRFWEFITLHQFWPSMVILDGKLKMSDRNVR